VKSTRQSKNEYIQMLLARGAPPIAQVLHADVSAGVVRDIERRLIAEHRRLPWNCDTADGNRAGSGARQNGCPNLPVAIAA